MTDKVKGPEHTCLVTREGGPLSPCKACEAGIRIPIPESYCGERYMTDDQAIESVTWRLARINKELHVLGMEIPSVESRGFRVDLSFLDEPNPLSHLRLSLKARIVPSKEEDAQ